VEQFGYRLAFYCFTCLGECKPETHEEIGEKYGALVEVNYNWCLPRTFQPLIMLLRGELDEVMIRSMTIGFAQVLPIKGMVAKYCMCPMAFPELVNLLKVGIPDFLAPRLDGQQFPVIRPGERVNLRISSPITDWGFWGRELVTESRRKTT
jgi:hypothetical protein